MNYSNYEDSIVQGRKIQIISWPAGVTFASPSTIGNLKDMRTLHDGWLAGSIRWIRMSPDQVKAHAADLQQHRDEGQVIGKKRKRQTTKAKKKTVQVTCDESSGGNAFRDTKNDLPSKSTTKRSKRTANSQMAPKSKEMITDLDSSDSGSD